MNRLLPTVSLCIGMILPASVIQAAVDYETEIKPLLRQHCISCHGVAKQEAELRLDAGVLILEGGSLPVVIPGKPEESELFQRISSGDKSVRMPPEGSPLTTREIELLKNWIEAGAVFPAEEVFSRSPHEHWAFQPISNPELPEINCNEWSQNPIDRFVYAKYQAEGIEPSDRASSSVLLRRVHLDLTGLPPTIQEQDQFAEKADLNKVISELLSRPEYGERWARHWLDVVRYADTNGYERDAEKPFVWRYRDYAIKSLNDDKPYDQFVLEQLAGDELPDRTLETMIATGYLRLGHWADEPADPKTDRYDQLDDIISTTGQAFLGLTIGCARCHDHKFEPISSKDYYSFLAVFNPLERPREGRTEKTVNFEGTEVYAWNETSPAPNPTFLLKGGSPSNLGEQVEPAVPGVLVDQQPEFPPAGDETCRRRLGLANWMISQENPLTARVIVNRVWQQHFGEGIVSTANDFGVMGAAPSNPELLDWLSYWFIHDADWSLKKLHDLMLSSRSWQSLKSPTSINRYRRLEVEAIRDSMLFVSGSLNPKRFGPGVKPPIPLAAIEANTDKGSVWQVSEPEETMRRSIYVLIKRGLIVPMFESLDLADTVSSCPKRQITTIAPQALTMFNGQLTQQLASSFAERLRAEAGSDPARQIQLAWQLSLSRHPSDSELEQMTQFLEKESLEELCRVIFNLNEFYYPE